MTSLHHLSDLVSGSLKDVNIEDFAALTLTTRDEVLQLVKLCDNPRATPSRSIVKTLIIQGRVNEEIVMQKNDLRSLCKVLPNLATFALDRVAWARPSEYQQDTEKYNGTINNFPKLVVRNMSITTSTDTTRPLHICPFDPQDLVYMLSLFKNVGEVGVHGLRGMVEVAPTGDPAHTARLESIRSSVCSNSWFDYPEELSNENHEQGIINRGLVTGCRVGKLVLYGGDGVTRTRWIDILREQSRLSVDEIFSLDAHEDQDFVL